MNKKYIADLRGLIKGWRALADSHYCQTYNKEQGSTLMSCARQLESVLREIEMEEEGVVSDDLPFGGWAPNDADLDELSK